MASVTCASCGVRLRVPDTAAQRGLRCPKCGASITSDSDDASSADSPPYPAAAPDPIAPRGPEPRSFASSQPVAGASYVRPTVFPAATSYPSAQGYGAPSVQQSPYAAGPSSPGYGGEDATTYAPDDVAGSADELGGYTPPTYRRASARRKKAASGGVPAWVWVLLVVVVLGVPTAVLLHINSASPITAENFAKLKDGMRRAEVEQLLGPSTEMSEGNGQRYAVWRTPAQSIVVRFQNEKVAAKVNVPGEAKLDADGRYAAIAPPARAPGKDPNAGRLFIP